MVELWLARIVRSGVLSSVMRVYHPFQMSRRYAGLQPLKPDPTVAAG
jgi:hypothetical protein